MEKLADDFNHRDLGLIEVKTRTRWALFVVSLQEERPHFFQRRWWDDRIMSWSMSDEALKVESFPFRRRVADAAR